jgi:hypothetical protein
VFSETKLGSLASIIAISQAKLKIKDMASDSGKIPSVEVLFRSLAWNRWGTGNIYLLDIEVVHGGLAMTVKNKGAG